MARIEGWLWPTITVNTSKDNFEMAFMLDGFYHDSRNEFIITKEDLNEIGITGACDIIEMKIDTSQPTLVSLPGPFYIALKHTTRLNFDDSYVGQTSFPNNYQEFVEVFNWPDNFDFQSEARFIFDVPFSWDGNSNLHVTMIKDRSSYQSTNDFPSKTLVETRYIGYHQDSVSLFPFDGEPITYMNYVVPVVGITATTGIETFVPPDTPILIGPEDGFVSSSSVEFSATLNDAEDPAVGDQVSLQVEYSQDSSFLTGVNVVSSPPVNPSTNVTVAAINLSVGTWYWRAKAIDSGDLESGFTTTRTFTIANKKPVINNLQPADNTIITSSSVTLSADVIDPEFEDVIFYYEVYDSLSMTNRTHTNQTSSVPSGYVTINVNNLNVGNNYWRVRAKDTLGNFTDWTPLVGLYYNTSSSGRLPLDTVIASTNLTNANVSNLADDPDSPDTIFATATSNTSAMNIRVGFPTTPLALKTGAGLQQFKALVKRSLSTSTANPTVTISVYENGVSKAAGTATTVNSSTGLVVSFSWDASVLTDKSGANVEFYMSGTMAGSGGSRTTVSVGAIEWNYVSNTDPQIKAPLAGTVFVDALSSVSATGIVELAYNPVLSDPITFGSASNLTVTGATTRIPVTSGAISIDGTSGITATAIDVATATFTITGSTSFSVTGINITKPESLTIASSSTVSASGISAPAFIVVDSGIISVTGSGAVNATGINIQIGDATSLAKSTVSITGINVQKDSVSIVSNSTVSGSGVTIAGAVISSISTSTIITIGVDIILGVALIDSKSAGSVSAILITPTGTEISANSGGSVNSGAILTSNMSSASSSQITASAINTKMESVSSSGKSTISITGINIQNGSTSLSSLSDVNNIAWIKIVKVQGAPASEGQPTTSAINISSKSSNDIAGINIQKAIASSSAGTNVTSIGINIQTESIIVSSGSSVTSIGINTTNGSATFESNTSIVASGRNVAAGSISPISTSTIITVGIDTILGVTFANSISGGSVIGIVTTSSGLTISANSGITAIGRALVSSDVSSSSATDMNVTGIAVIKGTALSNALSSITSNGIAVSPNSILISGASSLTAIGNSISAGLASSSSTGSVAVIGINIQQGIASSISYGAVSSVGSSILAGIVSPISTSTFVIASTGVILGLVFTGSASQVNVGSSVSRFRTLFDSLRMTDSVSKRYDKTVTDSILPGDSNTPAASRKNSLSDFITLDDEKNIKAFKRMNDSIVSSDTKTLATFRKLNDIIEVSDLLMREGSFFQQVFLSDVITLIDSIKQRSGKSLTETVSVNDYGFKNISKSRSDSISLTDSKSINISKVLYDDIQLNEFILVWDPNGAIALSYRFMKNGSIQTETLKLFEISEMFKSPFRMYWQGKIRGLKPVVPDNPKASSLRVYVGGEIKAFELM